MCRNPASAIAERFAARHLAWLSGEGEDGRWEEVWEVVSGELTSNPEWDEHVRVRHGGDEAEALEFVRRKWGETVGKSGGNLGPDWFVASFKERFFEGSRRVIGGLVRVSRGARCHAAASTFGSKVRVEPRSKMYE